MNDELKKKIDSIIEGNKDSNVWVTYEKCKKEIGYSDSFLEDIKYIVTKLSI